MADENQIIDRVRRKVFDFEEPRRLGRFYYADAVLFGAQKLGHDFGEPYGIAADIPTTKEFLLVKLATIEICYVLVSKIQSELDGDTDSDGEVSSITVPDLAVTNQVTTGHEKIQDLLQMAELLQEEYDGELLQSGGSSNAAEATCGNTFRISLRTGGYRKRMLDPGPMPRTLTGIVVGNQVALAWDKWIDETFNRYEILRSEDPGFDSYDTVTHISDNHEVSYMDTVSAGTYYYRVDTYNGNDIKASSNAFEAVVA